jgi:hypothetical protein
MGAAPAAAKTPSLWDAADILMGKAAMDPNGFSAMKLLPKDGMCVDCTILAGKIQVSLEDGKVAKISDGVYLHHAIAVDLNKKIDGFVTMCPTNVQIFGQPIKTGGAGGVNTVIGGAVVSWIGTG